MRFQNGCNKVVIGLRVVQFWSEIILAISNRTLACVASVSVLFPIKDRAKNGASKREGGGKKGRKRLQTNPGILKTAHTACHA